MSCTTCTPLISEEDLQHETEIYEESHDFADILLCPSCNKLFLQYWVEIYDDGWFYFTPLEAGEKEFLLESTRNPGAQSAIIKLIRTKTEVYCRHPLSPSPLRLQEGKHCLLEGAPW